MPLSLESWILQMCCLAVLYSSSGYRGYNAPWKVYRGQKPRMGSQWQNRHSWPSEIKPKKKKKRKLRKKQNQKEKKRKRKPANSPPLKYLKQRDSNFLGLALPEKLSIVGRCNGQSYWTERWKDEKCPRAKVSLLTAAVTRAKKVGTALMSLGG